jgi:mannose-6-phosphate isomerase
LICIGGNSIARSAGFSPEQANAPFSLPALARRNQLKLAARQVEKPWGRTNIPDSFETPNGGPVGEIWFEAPGAGDLPLLVKYIFTSEKLSVQVHPNDEQAAERGLPRGKNECWYILDCEPDARLGIGLRTPLSPAALRQAAIDGSIEADLDWKPVAPGDFFFVPAGTVHAIGAGIALLEIQQNSDVTYRLYDYGRPRELHLDDAIGVSSTQPYGGPSSSGSRAPVDTVLLDGPQFSVVRATSADAVPASLSARRRWIIPLQGCASSEAEQASAGECLLVEHSAPLSIDKGSVVLVAAEGTV